MCRRSKRASRVQKVQRAAVVSGETFAIMCNWPADVDKPIRNQRSSALTHRRRPGTCESSRVHTTLKYVVNEAQSMKSIKGGPAQECPRRGTTPTPGEGRAGPGNADSEFF